MTIYAGGELRTVSAEFIDRLMRECHNEAIEQCAQVALQYPFSSVERIAAAIRRLRAVINEQKAAIGELCLMGSGDAWKWGRDEALEEAVREAETFAGPVARNIANAIRALKDKP